MIDKKRCTDCKNWEYKTNSFGFCRANAPSPVVVKGLTTDEYTLVWPSTGRDDWCENGYEIEMEVVENCDLQ